MCPYKLDTLLRDEMNIEDIYRKIYKTTYLGIIC